MTAEMRVWAVDVPGPMPTRPLRLQGRPVPEPGPGQVRIAVSVCGVCRTDLHLAEGDLPPHHPGRVPGHEVVGVVDQVGSGCDRFEAGQRVGAAWLAASCGTCRYCLSSRENLCVAPTFTGWDIDGGFADYMVAREQFLYSLPDRFNDDDAAPLLCAGIIGYRALRLADLPEGGRLGIYGFGASAHLTAQVALAGGATVYVMTRSDQARQLALSLGASWAGGADEAPPESLDSAILFAPVGSLVPTALAALVRGGTLAVAGIHLSDIPVLRYQEHLFQERTLRSVTANTRRDGEEFLAVADRVGLRPTTSPYPFDATDQALTDLAADRVHGAAVVHVR